ncbi:MAG: MipA/OmpV family protein [Candidatus Omnitrophica bacterium]|nr:MipA/OmpV family protein [Candidatus Omnitrophota bacterium]
MEFCLSLLCCANLGWAQDAPREKGEFNVAGMGVYTAFRPYEDMKPSVTPIPIIKWRQGNFFIQGLKGGWVAFENDDWRADVFLSPQLTGYQADDSKAFAGMEDRHNSLAAGGRVERTIPWGEDLFLSVEVSTDVLNVYGGQEGVLALTKKFKGSFFEIVPSLGASWQSKMFVDYYYGVRDYEANASRSSYKGDAAWNPFVNLGFNMGLSKTCFLVTRFDLEFLGTNIKKSPIVNKNEACGIVTGVVVRF